MQHALKEWAVAVDALIRGEMIVVLRKGGIREEGGSFKVPYRQVWLYPTYEHQRPDLLKAGYADSVTAVEPGWHPETVSIQAWADITHVIQIFDAETVEALLPMHIWTEKFASERLKWKPQSPLYLLLLRVYRLSMPQTISYHANYGGCRSWITLNEPITISEFDPVLSDGDYECKVRAIHQIVEAQ
ncbi:MAG TPA: DUF1802 family protein [Elainellaceae cyanobacterium]|jgi:hypothetical protein